jgi:hypothetical protein
MKKIILVCLLIIIVLILIIVGVSNEWFQLFNNNRDENNKNYSVIGIWEVNHSWYENGTKIDEWTYDMTLYENGTSKFDLDNHSQISWEPYIFKNNQICYGDPGNEICYNIIYQDSGTRMVQTGTITNQYGEVIIIRDCKRK